jgi:FeS assembly SUF system protein
MNPLIDRDPEKVNGTQNEIKPLKEIATPIKMGSSTEITASKGIEAQQEIEPQQEIKQAKEIDFLTKEEPLEEIDPEILKEKVTEALKDIYDPEIPVNIYDLGLIYGLTTNKQGEVRVEITLTSPACPVAQTFPQTVQERLLQVPQVTLVAVELVWEPPWTKDRMTETAKLQLNMF